MPATRTQLIGGLFQDADGAILDSGYLLFELSQDEQVIGLNMEVCAGVKIKILLNSSGSVSTSPAQYIWGNDDLLPINSYYTISGYTAAGQLAWGPNCQQVTSGATFDVGTWIPSLLTNWQPSLQSPQLETNGVINGSQAVLNLKNGTNITITDDGFGGITITGPSSLVLKTKGVANVLQTLLNLLEGNGITLTDNGTGGVTIAGVSLRHNTVVNGSQTTLDLTNGSNITISDNGSGVITIALVAQPYDIGIPIVGQPLADERIGYIVPRAVTFVANFVGSYSTAAVASTTTRVWAVMKNVSTTVGTVTFSTSATGVFASTGGNPVSFAAGDLFELVAPSVVDANWTDGRFTFVGSR